MEAGQLGVRGILAVKVVEQVDSNAHETALNLRQEMVVNRALEHPNKIERATRTTVQVKSYVGTLCRKSFLVKTAEYRLFPCLE